MADTKNLMQKNVNPAVTVALNTRLFALQEHQFLANNLDFFKDFEKFLDKWTKTIRSLTDAFVDEAKKKGIPLYYNNEYGVDADIFNWLPNAQVVEGDTPKGKITMLEKNTKEGEMVKTALKLPLSQAIERMTQAVSEGYFSKNLKWLVIYLTDTKDGVPLELVCSRDDGKLDLGVGKVLPDGVWDVGGGREVGFFSNES